MLHVLLCTIMKGKVDVTVLYSYTSQFCLYTGQYGEKLLCVGGGGGGGRLGGISVENGWMAQFCFIYEFIFCLCVTDMLVKCLTLVSVANQ